MIRILTDTASDISLDYALKEDISLVSMKVNINNKEYIDKVNLSNDEFYQLLESSKDFPKTSQPAPLDFIKCFKEAKRNNDDLICILVSSNLSGTYQSATLAKGLVDYERIHLIDSQSATLGMTILVQEAKKMIKEGKDVKTIINNLEELKKHIKIYASVNTLEYLSKGGRISKAVATIGDMASLKPVITISEGKVAMVGKAIGINKAISMICKKIDNQIDTNYPVYTVCTQGETNVNKLITKIQSQNIQINDTMQIGPTIGSHVGPEAFGIVYIEK